MQDMTHIAATDLTPTIQLVFDGLFFFCFDDTPDRKDPAKTCQIGVLSTALKHELFISITETREGKSKEQTLHFNHSMCRLIDDVRLEINKGDASIIRRGYKGSSTPISDRPNPTAENKTDFTWMLDFENGEIDFKKAPRDIASDVFRPIIHLDAGEFYSKKLGPLSFSCIDSEGSKREFGFVAETIGVDINLKPDEEVTLTIESSVPLLDLSMKFKPEEGVKYLVYLQNVRPEHKRDAVGGEMTHMTASTQTTPQSDLIYYYQAFKNCPGNEQYDLEPDMNDDDRGAPPSICYPGGGSGSSSLSGGG